MWSFRSCLAWACVMWPLIVGPGMKAARAQDLGAPGPTPSTRPAGEVELRIDIAPNAQRRCGCVDARVVLRNGSDAVVWIIKVGLLEDLDFAVVNEAGQRMPLTRYGWLQLPRQQLPVEREARRIIRTLKPGESTAYDLKLNQYYDLTVPGTYSVQVKTRFEESSLRPHGELSSNVLRLKLGG